MPICTHVTFQNYVGADTGTILKQMQIIYGKEFDDIEFRKSYTALVYKNLLRPMKHIFEVSTKYTCGVVTLPPRLERPRKMRWSMSWLVCMS